MDADPGALTDASSADRSHPAGRHGVVVAFPNAAGPGARFLGLLGRIEAMGQRLQHDAAALAERAGRPDAAPADLTLAQAQLQQACDTAMAEHARLRAVFAEVARLDRLTANGDLAQALAGYEALARAIGGVPARNAEVED